MVRCHHEGQTRGVLSWPEGGLERSSIVPALSRPNEHSTFRRPYQRPEESFHIGSLPALKAIRLGRLPTLGNALGRPFLSSSSRVGLSYNQAIGQMRRGRGEEGGAEIE